MSAGDGRSVMVTQSWYCTVCGVDANFVHYSDTDSARVKEGVLLQHARTSPECTANDLGPIRFRDNRQMKD